MAAIKSVERIAHPKVDAGAALEFFKDAAVSLSIPGKYIWEGALYLESGAEGSAALFLQRNEHNAVQDVRRSWVTLTGSLRHADDGGSA